MMFNYEEIFDNEILIGIYEPSIGFIPTDPANSDYQAYLNKDNPDWNQPTL
jgi:hypothetical protein